MLKRFCDAYDHSNKLAVIVASLAVEIVETGDNKFVLRYQNLDLCVPCAEELIRNLADNTDPIDNKARIRAMGIQVS